MGGGAQLTRSLDRRARRVLQSQHRVGRGGDTDMNPGTVNPYAAPGADLDAGVAADALTLAGRGARLGAYILDAVVLGFIPGIVLLFSGIGRGPDASPSPIGLGLAGLFFLGVAVYQLWSLSVRGQTLGKKWLGIKIVKQDGSPVTFGSAVVMRALVPGLLGIVPGFGLIDILFIFRDDRRCIHDLIASTKVVTA
jgi:uncharacterized RDD family membrane protein YckC